MQYATAIIIQNMLVWPRLRAGLGLNQAKQNLKKLGLFWPSLISERSLRLKIRLDILTMKSEQDLANFIMSTNALKSKKMIGAMLLDQKYFNTIARPLRNNSLILPPVVQVREITRIRRDGLEYTILEQKHEHIVSIGVVEL